uniref:Uncharacterized protein n=1 Tax=Anguilla anguilla TaxID=7936 RepID=A0A0E9PQX4_ANGAN
MRFIISFLKIGFYTVLCCSDLINQLDSN